MNYNNYYVEQTGYGCPNLNGNGYYTGPMHQKGYGFAGPQYQKGYGYYYGKQYQKGYGLGDTFKKFFTWIVPLVKKHALPVLQSGAKAVGKQALSSISNIARDVVEGKNFVDSSKKRAKEAIDNLEEQADQALQGKGIKRSKKFKKYIILKKRSKNFKDIFNSK